jgi:DNA sulfur modification protein DndB
MQSAVMVNFFRALRSAYGDSWDDKTNALIYAGGFIGAIQFFRTKLIDFCVLQKSFEVDTIRNAMSLSPTSKILQEEIRGLGGTEAANKVLERLTQMFNPGEMTAVLRV